VEQTQIILVEMPGTLREIVREVVTAEPDLVLVDGGVEALERIPADDVCVAITSVDDPTAESLARLLGTRAQLRVIELSADGRHGTIYDLRLDEQPLSAGELSRADLLAAIRHPFGGAPDDRERECECECE